MPGLLVMFSHTPCQISASDPSTATPLLRRSGIHSRNKSSLLRCRPSDCPIREAIVAIKLVNLHRLRV